MEPRRLLGTTEIQAIRLGCADLHRAGLARFPFDFFEQTYAVVERRLNAVYRGEDLSDPRHCQRLVARAGRLILAGGSEG